MFRFWQTSEYSEWTFSPEADPHNPWAFARDKGASRVTIMAVSHDPEINGFEAISYSGPLFFDIDDSNLSKALQSAVELCEKLVNLGVSEEDLQIHLSGGKGVHIFIDSRIFSDGEPVERLPEMHRKLALDLFVPGLDLQVYSGQKGRMVRPPDALRPDGVHKVLVSLEELRDLDVEGYKQLVSKPRGMTAFSGPRNKAKVLTTLFNNVKKAVKASPPESEEKEMQGIGAEEFAQLEGAPPPCVEDLAEGKRSGATNFNQISLNVACWSARVNIEPELLSSIHNRIVENNPSSGGDSARVRKRKLQAMHQYALHEKKFKFSCGSILATVNSKPCSRCPLKEAKVSEGIPDHVWMSEKNGNWYSDTECTTLVSTFTMERDSVIEDEITGMKETSVILLHLAAHGRTHKITDFDERSWTSKQNFKNQIAGIDGAAFFGSDNDVIRMRTHLVRHSLTSGVEMDTIYKSSCVGINYRRRKGPDNVMDLNHVGRLTYVEPGFSMNDGGAFDTHMYVGPQTAAPKLSRGDFNTPIDFNANLAFSRLLKSNFPSVIAPMLGWFLLAHLKQHVYQVEHRNILLCVSGVAGTGKNSLAAVMQRLSGLSGEAAMYTLEAPNATKIPFQQACSNTTTVPRIINELNPKSVSKQQYDFIIEIIKAAFDSRSVSKGRLGGGDRYGSNISTSTWAISAPVMTLSEEPITEPAVMHRGIFVDMTPQGLNYGAPNFVNLEQRADDLIPIARKLVFGALRTPVKRVGEMLAGIELPEVVTSAKIPTRLKYGYKTIILAYDWAIQVLSEEGSGFSADNLKELKDMRGKFISWITDNSSRIARDSSVTEVDKVIRDFAIMAYTAATPDNKAAWAFTQGIHFVVSDGILYLDLLVAYPQYQKFKGGSVDGVRIRSAEAFLNVVRSMPYYISDTSVTEFLPTGGRAVLSLDMEALQDAGIPTKMFV
jgi:hypothetical protein